MTAVVVVLAASAGVVLYSDIRRDLPLWRSVLDRVAQLAARVRSRA